MFYPRWRFATVADASGALVPGATILVTDVSKGTTNTVQSNSGGEFAVDHLIPDVYDVSVAAAGFKGFAQKGIQLFADTSINVAAVLQVGGSDQVVEVSADSVPQVSV